MSAEAFQPSWGGKKGMKTPEQFDAPLQEKESREEAPPRSKRK